MIQKALGAARFLYWRVRLGHSLQTPNMWYVGPYSTIYARKGGKIQADGRLVMLGFNQLYSSGLLSIGKSVSINEYSRIVAHDRIEIGSHVTIAKFVAILDHDHRLELIDGELRDTGYVTAPIRIGNHVFIGDKATILKGVTIGDNVIIGAHSLVTSDIPANSVVGGVPGRVLKKLESGQSAQNANNDG